ncbi:MAG: ThiF family adenylyltransferase [Chitinophagales bacterium]
MIDTSTQKIISLKMPPSEWDSTFQMISWWEKDRVRNANVMVVGAGALGNEVLKNLTLLNVGNVFIVDFDTIEYSNLCRSILFRESDSKGGKYKADTAAERIREINPNINVRTIKGDISIDVGLGLFRRMDVVIGCLDNRLARLSLNRSCHKVNKVWIDGGIENLAGKCVVYKPTVSCYECSLSESAWANIKYKIGCLDVAQRNVSQGRIPTTPISSSIIGAMQVQESLKVIHNNVEQLTAGKTYYYEGMSNESLLYKSAYLKEDCLSHFVYEDIIESPLSADFSIEDVLSWLKEYFKDENPVIELDHDLILEINSESNKESIPVVIARPHFTNNLIAKHQTAPNDKIFITKDIAVIDGNFENQQLSLKEIGIPPLHIIKVHANETTNYVELTGDLSLYNF